MCQTLPTERNRNLDAPAKFNSVPCLALKGPFTTAYLHFIHFTALQFSIVSGREGVLSWIVSLFWAGVCREGVRVCSAHHHAHHHVTHGPQLFVSGLDNSCWFEVSCACALFQV